MIGRDSLRFDKFDLTGVDDEEASDPDFTVSHSNCDRSLHAIKKFNRTQRQSECSKSQGSTQALSGMTHIPIVQFTAL
jgi:hypothetical protein